MKRSASPNRDATASSDLWKSLKFSAAFLAASVFPETPAKNSFTTSAPAGEKAAAAPFEPPNENAHLFVSLSMPGSPTFQRASVNTLRSDDKLKYERLLKRFDQLKELPLPSVFSPTTPFEPGTPEAITHEHMKEMAALYAELLNTHRAFVGKNTPSFPFLGKMVSWLREGEIVVRDTNTLITEARAAGEEMWEYELSEAIARGGEGLSVETVMERLQGNSEAWAEFNPLGSPLPQLVDATAIPSSWNLSQRSLVALGTTSWAAARCDRGATLSESEQIVVKRALAALFAHPTMRAKQDPTHSRPQIDISQISIWAKIFAVRTLDLVDQRGPLLSSLPKNLQDPNTRASLKRSLQNDLCRDIGAFQRDPEMNKGPGGSFFHTSLTFSVISALRAEQQEPLLSFYLEKVFTDGAADNRWPYDTTRGFHRMETPRSSAGRGLAVHHTRFITEPTPTHAIKAIAALEQFYMYSGSLQANVSREGTHAGPDLIAPYYWAPGLYHAGRLCLEMSQRSALLSGEDSSRLRDITGKILRAALASFDPRHSIITHPGEATFQQIGPTFSTALTMTALRDLDQALRSLTPTDRASGLTQNLPLSNLPEGSLTRESSPQK